MFITYGELLVSLDLNFFGPIATRNGSMLSFPVATQRQVDCLAYLDRLTVPITKATLLK
jgi:hypothetical protein